MKSKVIVVTKQTSYSKYIQDSDSPNVFSDVQQLIDREHPAVARWKASHEAHTKTLDIVTEAISKSAQLVVTDAASFVAELQDVSLVVTVGGDGTLLSASHSVPTHIPILGVNSDPETSVGFFCGANASNVVETLRRILNNTCGGISLTRMMVSKNGRVIDERVLNDVLMCHTSPAHTSNYILEYEKWELRGEDKSDGVSSATMRGNTLRETQKSSGFWVGPAAGSTAARRSAGFEPLPLDSKDLQFCVRELYRRPGSEFGRREIVANPWSTIRVISKMDTAAMYIDGDYKVVPVSLGDEIIFSGSQDPLWLLGAENVLREREVI